MAGDPVAELIAALRNNEAALKALYKGNVDESGVQKGPTEPIIQQEALVGALTKILNSNESILQEVASSVKGLLGSLSKDGGANQQIINQLSNMAKTVSSVQSAGLSPAFQQYAMKNQIQDKGTLSDMSKFQNVLSSGFTNMFNKIAPNAGGIIGEQMGAAVKGAMGDKLAAFGVNLGKAGMALGGLELAARVAEFMYTSSTKAHQDAVGSLKTSLAAIPGDILASALGQVGAGNMTTSEYGLAERGMSVPYRQEFVQQMNNTLNNLTTIMPGLGAQMRAVQVGAGNNFSSLTAGLDFSKEDDRNTLSAMLGRNKIDDVLRGEEQPLRSREDTQRPRKSPLDTEMLFGPQAANFIKTSGPEVFRGEKGSQDFANLFATSTMFNGALMRTTGTMQMLSGSVGANIAQLDSAGSADQRNTMMVNNQARAMLEYNKITTMAIGSASEYGVGQDAVIAGLMNVAQVGETTGVNLINANHAIREMTKSGMTFSEAQRRAAETTGAANKSPMTSLMLAGTMLGIGGRNIFDLAGRTAMELSQPDKSNAATSRMMQTFGGPEQGAFLMQQSPVFNQLFGAGQGFQGYAGMLRATGNQNLLPDGGTRISSTEGATGPANELATRMAATGQHMSNTALVLERTSKPMLDVITDLLSLRAARGADRAGGEISAAATNIIDFLKTGEAQVMLRSFLPGGNLAVSGGLALGNAARAYGLMNDN